MNRVRSSAVVIFRKPTRTVGPVVRPTPSNPIGSTSVLGVANLRRVSSAAGGGPSASLVLAVAAGLPIALWTYKVGFSAV